MRLPFPLGARASKTVVTDASDPSGGSACPTLTTPHPPLISRSTDSADSTDHGSASRRGSNASAATVELTTTPGMGALLSDSAASVPPPLHVPTRQASRASTTSVLSAVSTPTTVTASMTPAPRPAVRSTRADSGAAGSPTAASIAARSASQLNAVQAAFYRSFYRLDPTLSETELITHYNTTGVSRKFVPNVLAYTDIACHILHFNPGVYSANWNAELKSRLKDVHPHFTESDFLQHCFGTLTDHWVEHHIPSASSAKTAAAEAASARATPKHLRSAIVTAGGANAHARRTVAASSSPVLPGPTVAAALARSPVQLFLNRLDIVQFQLRWKTLYKTLHQKYVHFDPGFYVLFYEIDACEEVKQDPSAMFLQWLEKWLFQGRYPNHRMFQDRTQLVSLLLRAVHDMGVDINFVVKTYLPILSAAGALASLPAELQALTDVERALLVFFRFGPQYQFYWNELEMDMRRSTLRKHFCELNESLREDGNAFSNKVFARLDTQFQTVLAQTQQKLEHTVIHMPKLDLSPQTLDHNVRLLSTMTHAHFFRTFCDINGLSRDDEDAVHSLILCRFVPNVARVSASGVWGELNSMSVKAFVASYLYNAYAPTRRRAMGKLAFLQFVKTRAVACLDAMYQQCHIEVAAAVLETDLQFLIEHHKILKLAKLSIQIALMLYLL